MRAYHGPRRASWTVYAVDPTCRTPGCRKCWRPLVSVGTATDARRDAAYYRAECGYLIAVERTEFCPAPGCDGHWATVKVRGRGGMYRDKPCLLHEPPVETVECVR